jgi:regulator of sigma E protease
VIGMSDRTWRDRVGDFWRYLAPSLVALALLVLAVSYPRLALFAVVTLLILTPCVLVHEWGHYVVARRSGMQVLEFSIGFGNRLVSRVRGGVRWSLKAIPLGGSVEVAGMTVEQLQQTPRPESGDRAERADGPDVDPERSFVRANPTRRAAMIYAGIGMNLLLAWLAFTVVSVALAPPDGGWATYLLIPVNGLVVLVRLAAISVQSLAELVINWAGSDLGSVFSMPAVLSAGVSEAQTTGMPMWMFLALVVGLVNLSLAVFNFLPLYPLDGYHGLVAIIDGLRRTIARRRGLDYQPLTTAQLGWMTKTSAFCFAILVVLIVGKDVVRLFG